MSFYDDGGPAFPVIAENGLGHITDGMRLRDYFAAKAMQTIISQDMENGWSHSFVASDAYRYADAMLLERSKS